jgi:capsular polysaccharide transport system permease protein
MSEAEIRRVLDIAAELSSSFEKPDALDQVRRKKSDLVLGLGSRAKQAVPEQAGEVVRGFNLRNVSLLSSAASRYRIGDNERPAPRPRPALVANEAMCGPPPQAMLRKSGRGIFLSLFACVMLPTVALGCYYYCFAADQYVSEFRFSLSRGRPVLPAAPDTSTTTGPGTALAGASAVAAAAGLPQTFIVSDYLVSRQAVDDLQARINVKAMYARDDLGWWERFDLAQPDEAFVEHFQRYVRSSYDPVSGIAVGSVRAYRAGDAYLIAKTLAELAEKLVNDIDDRSYAQAIRFAESEVESAERTLGDVNSRLLAYRTKQAAVDPQNSAAANNIALSQSLQASLANLLTRLNSQPALDPDSPSAKSYMTQIAAAKNELAKIESQIAGDGPPSPELALMIGHYEDLIFDQQTWQNILLQARHALEAARVNASAQHLYVTPYVLPGLPASSTYPNRPVKTLFAGMIFFALWSAGRLLYRSVRD